MALRSVTSGMDTMERPSIVMLPDHGTMRQSDTSSVVLPAPVRPTTPIWDQEVGEHSSGAQASLACSAAGTFSPASMVNDTLSNAGCASLAYVTDTLRSSTRPAVNHVGSGGSTSPT